jgi:hypothetical protein
MGVFQGRLQFFGVFVEIENKRAICEATAGGCDFLIPVEERTFHMQTIARNFDLERNVQTIDGYFSFPQTSDRLCDRRRGEAQSRQEKNPKQSVRIDFHKMRLLIHSSLIHKNKKPTYQINFWRWVEKRSG